MRLNTYRVLMWATMAAALVSALLLSDEESGLPDPVPHLGQRAR